MNAVVESIDTLCDKCAASTARHSIVLCAQCATKFRVLYLPKEIRAWGDIAHEARSFSGVDAEELVRGLMVRVFNQQRELSKLNRRIEEMRVTIRKWVVLLTQARGLPKFGAPEQSAIDDDEVIHRAAIDVRRYGWCRRGNVYALEDGLVRGGPDLDKLCDEAVRHEHGINT